ncbi:MAG TPA: YCF48-related protein [Bacteroidia bacterium]|nr:YCF48-related protein [Bacteroidia bacterium]HRH09503.1 YCF48-related protein [Bacteroidia bacterium]
MKKLLFLICLLSVSFSNAQMLTWQQVLVPTTKNLNCIEFPTPQVGYIGGADSLLLKTIDGGLTWNAVPFNGISFLPGGDDFLKLDFVSANIGYATVGPYSGIYQTVDGGLNWTGLSTTLCFNQGLFFTADGEGFVGGSGCFQGERMIRFSSGTPTQATINTPSWSASDMVVDIDFSTGASFSLGLAVSSGGRILRSIDGGLNWDTLPSPLGNAVPLTSITIVDTNLAYVGYNNGSSGLGLLISIDGGLTWTMDLNSATFFYPIFHELHTTSASKTFAGAQSISSNTGLIMESTNTGWWNMYTMNEAIYSITSVNDTMIWAAGKNGYLVKTVDPNSVSISTIHVEEPVKLFPNPTSDFLTIQLLNEAVANEFIIEIYSVEGKLIKKGEVGKSTIQVSDLAPGDYYAKVIHNSGISISKFVKL